jgi:hypothetical protein
MTKKPARRRRNTAATAKRTAIPESDTASKKNSTDQQPSVIARIQALLNELTDAELNILIYEIENPQETRTMRKLGRIASARLKRPKAIKELAEMLIDYSIEQHPKLETHYLTDKYRLVEYFYDHCI